MDDLEGSNLIQDGSTVIIQKGDYMQCVKIKKNKVEQIGRQRKCFSVKFANAIGEPFGTTFRIVNASDRRGSDLEKMTLNELEEFSLMQDDGACGTDNRNLSDDGSSQSMTTEDIKELRRKGASGEEVVQTILSNSSTFASKTAFSQEKYIKRKGKKYTQPITVHRPSVDMLADMFYKNAPGKISNLRPDTLFQLVTHANVSPGCRVAVYDSGSCKLVLSAVLAAVGEGRVVDVSAGFPSMAGTAMAFMDFSDEQLSAVSYLEMENLHTIPLPDGTDVDTSTLVVEPSLPSKPRGKASNPEAASEKTAATGNNCTSAHSLASTGDTASGDTSSSGVGDTTSNGVTSTEGVNEAEANGEGGLSESNGKVTDEEGVTRKIRKKANRPSNQTFKMRFVRSRLANLSLSRQVLSAGVTSLVVSCGYRTHPLQPLQALWPYLLPGCPFVVACPYLQPLEEMYMKVKSMGGNNLRVCETFLREFQCLPERTHPHVMMSASGGYFLRGTKVEASSAGAVEA